MDSLPNEVLANILRRLSQRYAVTVGSTVCKAWHEIISQPFFYTTLHIYSEQQLKACIRIAKEGTTLIDKQHLIFYFPCILKKEEIIDLIFAFPAITSTNGLIGESNYILKEANSSYPPLEQLTHFSFWYVNKQWMNTLLMNQDIIHSLDFLLSRSHSYTSQQPPPPIHLKPIQPQRHSIPHSFNNDTTTTITTTTATNNNNNNDDANRNNGTNRTNRLNIVQLVLPNLTNLTNLNISMRLPENRSYYIDESTFESIHKSCPQLKSLNIDNIKMVLSKDYLLDSQQQSLIQPAFYLKKLNIYGLITDPKCYTYFSLKYPRLEFFIIKLIYSYATKEVHLKFQQAIYNMLLQFPLLRAIAVTLPTSISRTLNQPNAVLGNHWPWDDFLVWLKQNPQQLTHLEYPLEYYFNLNHDDANNNNNIMLDGIGTMFVNQHSFINHLTSLSLTLHAGLALVSIYLSQNKNRTNSTSFVVSTLLEEIEIRGSSQHSQCLYISDWLVVFPNMTYLRLCNIPRIQDTYNDDDSFDSGDNAKGEMGSHFLRGHQIRRQNKFHKLIQNPDSQQQLNGTWKKYHHDYYKLECLEIIKSDLYFKEELSGFLKKCQKLKKLELTNIKYAISSISSLKSITTAVSNSMKDIYIDSSHLYLEYLAINNLYIIPWYPNRSSSDMFFVNKLIIHEILSDQQRIINEKGKIVINNPRSTLSFKCKYIDGLVFNST
ncbi:hypothetical protein BJ944DRAFT_269278 [Cunninghamella echinulata]|nr:hypothetical protein BJ944DRAFT_269278 [Cunninghamella echinulata]